MLLLVEKYFIMKTSPVQIGISDDQGTKQTFYIQSLKRIFEKLKISKTWLLSIRSCYILM